MSEAEEQEEYQIDLGAEALDAVGDDATALDTADLDAEAFDTEAFGVVDFGANHIDDGAGADDFDLQADAAHDGNDQSDLVAPESTQDQGDNFEFGYEEEEPKTRKIEDALNTVMSAAATTPSRRFLQAPERFPDNDEIDYDSDDMGTSSVSASATNEAHYDGHESAFNQETEARQEFAQNSQPLAFQDHVPDDDMNAMGYDDVETNERVDTNTGLVHGDYETEIIEPESVHFSTDLPDVTVVWNGKRYPLFGSQEDEPDSYFLSNSADLDCPLSQFLSRLREVVLDEISPNHELLIRVGQLSLVFGEKSQGIFLSRSFREILDCYNKLVMNDGGLSSTMILYLETLPSCEERFLELLEGADQGKGLSEMIDFISDDQYESSPVVAGNEEIQNDENSNEYREEDAAADNGLPNEGARARSELELVGVSQEAEDLPETRGEAFGEVGLEGQTYGNASLLDENPAQQVKGGFDEETQEITYEELGHIDDSLADPDSLYTGDIAEKSEVVDEEIGITQEADDAEVVSDALGLAGHQESVHLARYAEQVPSLDNVLEQVNQGQVRVGQDESVEFGTANDHEDPSYLNDATDLGTIDESHIDENAYAEGDNFGQYSSHVGDANKASNKVTSNGTTYTTAPAEASTGTSATSTLNGEEAENHHRGDEYNHESHEHHEIRDPSDWDISHQQSGYIPGGEEVEQDEIDWEAGDDEVYEEIKESAVLTPSSISGKRSRQLDTAQGLAEESDNKRRRT